MSAPDGTARAITLVILAGGRGTRFGGAKQLEPVGPAGEALLDYTIRDASTTGFSRTVIVARSDIDDAIRSHVSRMHPDADITVVCQDRHGPHRDKPWGTAHALLAAAETVPGPFATANADDYYGAGSLALLAPLLSITDAGSSDWFLVAFPITGTLSASGPVSRGVCQLDDDGQLVRVTEERVQLSPRGTIQTVDGTEVRPDTLVSMNLWGLAPPVFDCLASGFDPFAAAHLHDGEEYRLPDEIARLLSAGRAGVRVVRSDAPWAGITHRADLPGLRRFLAELDRTRPG
ncbi:MAG: hypothetical protein JJLCMIEE_01643 [Acidimicrobiales bacterium]|nr:hypothetical protein [Acidimicrobiales bacterium]RIK05115.1 MAG: nucleotidyltransferase [Acidobacteriota bacterium]